jgi:biotin carboxyl carrier protein
VYEPAMTAAMTDNGHKSHQIVAADPPQRHRSSLPILILAVLFVSATFLTWYYTWFGRDLTDQEISQYLADEKHPRHVQHALLQIEQRLDRGQTSSRQWYPRILELTGHPETEFRMTSAWLMGYDSKSPEFHQALLKLLSDPEAMVRRNAALALVRFNDASGREELLAALKPFAVAAAGAGTISSTLKEGSNVSRGTMLARVVETSGNMVEIRSPIPGKIEKVLAENGRLITSGDTILTLNSDANSVWEALRGLALIGKAEDLSEIERYAQGVGSMPDRIKKQAALTAKAIQSRATQNSQKG